MGTGTGVTPEGTFSAFFDPDPASVSRARTFAVGAVRQLGAQVDLALLELLVSELVTNAVVHAVSPVELELDLTAGEQLRVRVRDEGPGTPIVRQVGLLAEGGRGLGLIDATSQRWGVELADGGKYVWFEMGPDSSLL